MIQDIGAFRYHNEYRHISPKEDSKILSYRNGRILLKNQGDEISFLTLREVKGRFPGLKGEYRYLFSIDNTGYFLQPALAKERFANIQEKHQDGELVWAGIDFLRRACPREEAFAGVTGFQLSGWYQSRRFCPACGQKMRHSEGERMMYCSACGQREYPKLNPAVIVAVTEGDKLLLTKYAGRAYTKYALIAGYTEIGETVEETVQREVMEEVGLKVKNIRYYKSQPWSFTDTLLMGFFAEVDGDDTIRLDENELQVAKWCSREEIPENDGISLTREMMEVFKNGKV
ncbi:MAG TPA: NAD(+) diphosphatase [Candidatus Choladousia intestinavium]|uniref:NAD(+) diphosphatase n=1 Tax=Candidatus Choladousia intestinavium TaxID=2840727 RepID=A0A9D1D8X5_9FIRM|nr:NAD(+) diphosphatase [Candidatus Choladousia intestinavium]